MGGRQQLCLYPGCFGRPSIAVFYTKSGRSIPSNTHSEQTVTLWIALIISYPNTPTLLLHFIYHEERHVNEENLTSKLGKITHPLLFQTDECSVKLSSGFVVISDQRFVSCTHVAGNITDRHSAYLHLFLIYYENLLMCDMWLPI